MNGFLNLENEILIAYKKNVVALLSANFLFSVFRFYEAIKKDLFMTNSIETKTGNDSKKNAFLV